MKRILIAAFLILAVSANVFATSYTYPFRVGTTSIDSVWVIWKYKSTGTKVDSFHFVATSGNLDKDTSFTSRVAESSYVLQYRWYWQTLASATQKYAVSYDDVAAILPTATAVVGKVTLVDTSAAAISHIYDSVKLYDNWIRDSIHNQSVAVLAGKVTLVDTSAAAISHMYDSIKLYDNWIRDSIHNQSVAAIAAIPAKVTLVDTSAAAISHIYDSIKLYDNWIRDSIHNQSVAVLAGKVTLVDTSAAAISHIYDSIKLYDNWIRDSIHNQSVAAINSLKDSSIYTAAYKHMISLHADSGATGSAPTLSQIWHYRVDTVTTDSSAGKYLTNSYKVGGAVTVNAYAAGMSPKEQILITPSQPIATDASGQVSVGSNVDKTGYSLSATERANLADTVWGAGAGGHLVTRALKGTQTGITIPTVTDLTNWQKTGYSLSASQNFNNTGSWTGSISGSVGSVTGNVGGNVGGSVASVTGSVGGNVTGSVGSVASGGLDSLAFTAAAKHMIAKHSDSGTVAVIDSAALAGVTLVTTVPDSLLATVSQSRAMYSKQIGGSAMKIRFVSLTGDNSDGTTPAKAKTSPNYFGSIGDSNTIVFVADGKYDTVHVQVLARNFSIIGNGARRTIFVDSIKARGTAQLRAIEVFKPNFFISGVEFISTKDTAFSFADEDSLYATTGSHPWPCAIEFWGTAHNGRVTNCYFGRRNYKTIVTIDTTWSGKCDTARAVLNLEIDHNTFRDNQMFSLDINPHGGYIHDNTFTGIQSAIDNGAAAIQLYTRSRDVVITNNFFDSVGIAVACQNDTNTLITHNNYGYFFPYGARITNGSSVNCTVDEPSLYPAPVLKPEMVNLVSDPSLEKWYADKTLQTKQTDFTGPYLSRTLPGDTAYPDARIVTSKFHTGAASWYANCLYRSNPATNAQQATFGYDTTYALYLDTGLYMASAWVWAVNNSITSIKIRDFGQVDSTYDTTRWADAIDSQWVQVRSYFRHTRTGKVKVQWITHHNSTCFWDDFFFGKVAGQQVLASLDTLKNSASSLRSSSTLTLSQANLDSIVSGVLAGIGGGSGGGIPITVSGNSYTTISSLRVAIREATQIYSTSLMPDSVINDAAVRAAVGVSTDIGGYEASLSFQTVPGVSRYPLSDTIINVIYGWVKSNQGSVYALKSWYPQFFDDFKLPNLSGENTDQETPVCYRLWADSVELLPTPSKVDTVKMDVLVQHPFVSVLPGQDGLKLRPTFFDAVMYRACRDLMVGIDLTEKATAFGQLYEGKKKELLDAYARRLDVRSTK